jgi:hypothetical protein
MVYDFRCCFWNVVMYVALLCIYYNVVFVILFSKLNLVRVMEMESIIILPSNLNLLLNKSSKYTMCTVSINRHSLLRCIVTPQLLPS